MSRSLDQEAATFAWSQIDGRGRPTDEYVNAAKAAPALIMSNGLMQTLAFYKAKDKPHTKALMGDVLAWLGQRMALERPAAAEGPALGGNPGFSEAMRFLQKANSDQYMRATEEAQVILKWIRQFADALKNEG